MESSVLSPWQHDGSRDIIGQALIVALLTLSNQKFWSAVNPTTTTTKTSPAHRHRLSRSRARITDIILP